METMFTLLRRPQEVADKRARCARRDARRNPLRHVVSLMTASARFEGHQLPRSRGKTVAVVAPRARQIDDFAHSLSLLRHPIGKVTIDGQDVATYTSLAARGYPYRSPGIRWLFNDTIRYNIGYGRIDASEEEILEAARWHRSIPSPRASGRLQGMVGERGLKLSAARSSASPSPAASEESADPAATTEATSALDTHTEPRNPSRR